MKLFVVRIGGTAEMEGFFNFRDEKLRWPGRMKERLVPMVKRERAREGGSSRRRREKELVNLV